MHWRLLTVNWMCITIFGRGYDDAVVATADVGNIISHKCTTDMDADRNVCVSMFSHQIHHHLRAGEAWHRTLNNL